MSRRSRAGSIPAGDTLEIGKRPPTSLREALRAGIAETGTMGASFPHRDSPSRFGPILSLELKRVSLFKNDKELSF